MAVRAAAIASAAGTASGLPHLVFVMVDDWGWANAGYHRPGVPEVVTPTVDRLVREGIELDRHYTYHYCSPTRASLQSGRLPIHVATTNDDPAEFNPADPVSGYAGIPRNMTGIAEKLKSAGYRTHATGKWDAGMVTWEHTPMGRGFETWFGYYHHANDYWTQQTHGAGPALCGKDFVDLWNTTGPARDRNGTGYEEQMFTEHTLATLDRHDASEPLFLYHAFHQIHTPLEIPEAWEKNFSFIKDGDERKYAAMVQYMDMSLGKIVAKLQEKSMWANTLMVVSSDNGGPIYNMGGKPTKQIGGANNNPLRGGKMSDWEGGIRVNAFVTGGVVPQHKQGTRLEDFIHISDWYTTFCAIAGVDSTDEKAALASLPPVDGMDHSRLLIGNARFGSGNRTEIHHGEHSLTRGPWKIIMGGFFEDIPQLHGKGSDFIGFGGRNGGWGVGALRNDLSFKYCKHGCLYNVIADPGEYQEVGHKFADVKAEMMARLKDLNQGIFRPVRTGGKDPRTCSLWNGFFGPFIGVPDEYLPSSVVV